MSVYRPLICLTILHILVDACAILIGPLWGQLRDKYALGETSLFIVLAVQSLSPSLSQVVFGYLRDRISMRATLWIGPALAAMCLSLIGFADHVFVLCGLLIVGGISIGAFHPISAVAAGRALPGQPTRGLSLFMFGGAIGLAVGPIISGAIVGQLGLSGLIVIGPIFVGLILFLTWLGRLQDPDFAEPDFAESTRQVPRKTTRIPAQRIRLALLLLAVCSLRVVPNMAMEKILAFQLSDQHESALTIGFMQSIFLVSASVGMLVMAYRFPTGLEKTFLIVCPILGIPMLYALGLPDTPRWLLVSLLIPSGLIMWGTTPVMVSYAHQQFPRSAGFASALTMGLSWGVGGMIQAKLTATHVAAGHPERAFHAFIPCLAVSALCAAFLPGAVEQSAVEKEELADDGVPAIVEPAEV